MKPAEIREKLLAMGAEPLFINGHRVCRYYQNVFTVDQREWGIDIYDPIDVDKATELVLAQRTYEVQS